MKPSLPAPPADWHPSAVVFDCDGVLMDTETAWAGVQERVAADYGVDFNQAALKELMGLSAADVAQWITDRAGEVAEEQGREKPSLSEVYDHLIEVESEVVSSVLEPLPGALETVRAFAERMPVAVASNSTAQVLDRKVHALGLDEVITTWVSSDDVPDGKPAPDIYEEAVRRLGVDPDHALAIEDSPAGTTAASKAGLYVLGVPNGHDEPLACHFIADSLADPRVREFMTGWGL
ncbi:HAD family phosphatase [Kocuria carniphila]|uniref:HAD family hydrolase n=1 Tax=Kocuria carniphila TaxID=262208 RepID=UPI0028ED529F|nr:HAD family phosphatase [Kocuria carniphila]